MVTFSQYHCLHLQVDWQKETQDKMTFDLEYLQSVLSYMSNLRVPITLEGDHEKIHEYCRFIESIAEVCQVKVRELKERYDEFSSKTCDEFSKMKIEVIFVTCHL